MTTLREEMEKSYADMLQDCEWGLEDVPVGWLEMVDSMLASWDELKPQPRIHQIKSKFAMLRVYGIGLSNAMCASWETVSMGTCETCGGAGDRSVERGWWRVECEDCKLDRKAGGV